jgi:hypothetical protein
MSPHVPEHQIDDLRDAILALVGKSDIDPMLKPFAALLAAAHVAQFASETSEPMRMKLAHAFVLVLRGLAPELVITLPRGDESRPH